MAAVKVAYRGMMERGRQPVAVLFLDVPLSDVDVNVHPTKVEVRFDDSSAVFRATRRTIVQTLSDTPWVPVERRGDGGGVPPHSAERNGDAGSYSVETTAERVYQLNPDSKRRPVYFGDTRTDSESGLNLRGGQSTGEGYRDTQPRPPASGKTLPSSTSDGPPADGYFASLNFVGQIHGTYLLCADRDGLVVVDMHAAHERITFEDLRKAWSERQVDVQSLLIPDMLQLDSLRASILSEHIDFFGALGFEIEPFGGADFALKAVPAFLQNGSLKSLITDTLDEIGDHGESERIEEAIDTILIRMACHGSLRSGDTVHREEAYELFKQLDEVDFGANCPHGRPVFFRMSVAELESRFSRR
jgi:DNA mismatch repair protein MutL